VSIWKAGQLCGVMNPDSTALKATAAQKTVNSAWQLVTEDGSGLELQADGRQPPKATTAAGGASSQARQARDPRGGGRSMSTGTATVTGAGPCP
jgi:hypothetical protein